VTLAGEVRLGWGIDVHRFGGSPPLLMAGVVVDSSRGVMAHSDGDVVAHAVSDAVLGAAALGDMGEHFPSDDPQWDGADSMMMLRRCVDLASSAGVVPTFCDVTVVGTVRVAPYRLEIRSKLAGALDLSGGAVSIKATTTDGVGFVGRDEGLAALAAVTAVCQ